MLDSYVEYLTSRWDEGCHSASQLWRELVERGYLGARIQVARWARQRREVLVTIGSIPTGPKASLAKLPGSRSLVWLLIRAEAKLDAEEVAHLKHILQDPDIVAARSLAQRFGAMVRERRPDLLADWLQACRTSGIAELRNFATYIERDSAAVRAGLTERWSNGQTEGQITIPKLIKRQMYGRAGFYLLRRRVLQLA
jgi:transposase